MFEKEEIIKHLELKLKESKKMWEEREVNNINDLAKIIGLLEETISVTIIRLEYLKN